MSQNMIFDVKAKRAQRRRTAPRLARLRPVLDDLANRVLDRLDDSAVKFTRALDIGGRGAVAPMLTARGISVISADLATPLRADLVIDAEAIPFAEHSFDLIIAHCALHWVNDLPGTLVQLRRILRPGGLFLASLPLAGTLTELRAALLDADIAFTEGAVPHIAPFPDLADCAALLQRAGFALPVAERDTIRFEYRNRLGLLRDLQDAGEANALIARPRAAPPRLLFAHALARLAPPDRVAVVTLQLGVLTGWAS